MRDEHQQCNIVMENPVEACFGAIITTQVNKALHKSILPINSPFLLHSASPCCNLLGFANPRK